VRSRLHGIWPRRVEGAGSGLQGAWAGGGGSRAGPELVVEGRMRGLGCRKLPHKLNSFLFLHSYDLLLQT
jgi:hypothetical protein